MHCTGRSAGAVVDAAGGIVPLCGERSIVPHDRPSLARSATTQCLCHSSPAGRVERSEISTDGLQGLLATLIAAGASAAIRVGERRAFAGAACCTGIGSWREPDGRVMRKGKRRNGFAGMSDRNWGIYRVVPRICPLRMPRGVWKRAAPMCTRSRPRSFRSVPSSVVCTGHAGGAPTLYPLLDLMRQPSDATLAERYPLGKLPFEFEAPDVHAAIGDTVDLLQLLPGAKLQLMRHRVLRVGGTGASG